MKGLIYAITLCFAICCLALPSSWAAPPTDAAWEKKWNTTLAEAKKEGTVSVYTSWGAAGRVAVTKAFKDKYGINLEFTNFGRGALFIAKYQAEMNAGINMADVFCVGASTLLVMAKPAGFMGQIEPYLILPEVVDPKAWRGGSFFLDKDKQAIKMAGNTMRFVGVNTNMIKRGEITSYKDILKPQYRGKVTLNDPSIQGAGIGLFGHLALHIWTQEEASEYMRQLLKNDTQVMRDQRLQGEWLVRGRSSIALALDANGFNELIGAEAPIEPVVMKEGTYISTSDSALAVPKVSPHPNATKVFLNWLLSNEGQRVYSGPSGAMSLRGDVPPTGINPGFIPGPTEKTFTDTEEYILKRGTLLDVTKKIFTQSAK